MAGTFSRSIPTIDLPGGLRPTVSWGGGGLVGVQNRGVTPRVIRAVFPERGLCCSQAVLLGPCFCSRLKLGQSFQNRDGVVVRACGRVLHKLLFPLAILWWSLSCRPVRFTNGECRAQKTTRKTVPPLSFFKTPEQQGFVSCLPFGDLLVHQSRRGGGIPCHGFAR